MPLPPPNLKDRGAHRGGAKKDQDTEINFSGIGNTVKMDFSMRHSEQGRKDTLKEISTLIHSKFHTHDNELSHARDNVQWNDKGRNTSWRSPPSKV